MLTVLWVWAAFPPSRTPEFAYLLAVPALWWAGRAPAWKLFGWTMWLAWSLAWIVGLAWLHHVTYVGLVLLGAFLGALTAGWFLAARWAWPRALSGGIVAQVLATLGLGGLWVVGEWVRSWIFTGFPWMPLAATQWERPLALALCPYVGAYGVSALLIVFNLGLASYLHRFGTGRLGERRHWLTPPLGVALVALILGTFALAGNLLGQQRVRFVRVGIVQPYIPQDEKWNRSRIPEILRILEAETLKVAAQKPDFIVWPEASVPLILHYDPGFQPELESLAKRAGVPLLVGVVVVDEPGTPQERWTNAAVVVDPARGLIQGSYAKRHLVPFGEYVPLGRLLSWIKKLVPIGEDFRPGENAQPLSVPTARGPLRAGLLICYEDVFASLGRESAEAGGELLTTITNDAWYGEGAAAYQHAAHSALRAAETRRPMVRAGNGGWSGWMDEYGTTREVLRDERGTVYFRGGGVVEVTRDARWVGKQTPYTQHGDWFVGVCAALAAFAAWRLFHVRTLAPNPS